METTQKCPICGDQIRDKAHPWRSVPRLYCSMKCYTRARKGKPLPGLLEYWRTHPTAFAPTKLLECTQCGKSLVGKKDQRRFCSSSCFYASRRFRLRVQCVQCGAECPPRRTKFCSMRCQGIYRTNKPASVAAMSALTARWAKNRSPDGQPLCRRCRVPLVSGENAHPGKFQSAQYICKKCRARETTHERRLLRAEVFKAYGGRCVCCEEWRQEFLTIDHTAGYVCVTGEPRSAYPLYRWLRRHSFPTDRFRLLCMNCNHSFALFGYCPHGGTTGPQLRMPRTAMYQA